MSRSDSAGEILAVALVALSLGCVETSLREAREPMDYEALPAAPPRPTTDGSIWTGATQSGSFLFFDEKAATVGDLVTVVIVEATEAQGDARTETDARRLANLGLSSDVGFQKLVASPVQGLLRVFGFDDEGTQVDQGDQLNVNCTKCKQSQPSKKVSKMQQCPPVLILHLKRFRMTS